MARSIHRLTTPEVRTAKAPALIHDGGGLYLQVTPGSPNPDGTPGPDRKSWLLRYQSPAGKRREMGLGAIDNVSLGAARIAADAARKRAGAGIDPIEHRKLTRANAAAEAARAMTFRQAAEAYVKAQTPSWRSEKHAKLWRATLEKYAHPALGALPVAAIDVSLVLKVLEPVWSVKPETASRVRGRIEAVLDWAAVRGYRSGDNPARWRGHLQKALPARSQVKPVQHHPALPFAEVADFMTKLRSLDGLGAVALELTILTATRSNEMLGARWSEIRFREALWTVPADRMKANRDHRIPLSAQAVIVLKKLRELNPRADLVFPGQGTLKQLSGMAMLMTLRRLKRTDLTVHGFRSTFRDWAADATQFPREVAEAALAHAVGDKVEAAYRRGDALEKRRLLMQSWADYCDRSSSATVVTIGEAKAKRAHGSKRG